DLCRARPRAGGGAGDRAGVRPDRGLRAGDVRHAGDQRGRLPLHDHGAHLPQRAAQEGQRADPARRALERAGGARGGHRQQGRRGRRLRGGGRRVGGQAREVLAGDHAPGQGRDAPPARHEPRRRAGLPARAAEPGALHAGHRGGRERVLREARAAVERALMATQQKTSLLRPLEEDMQARRERIKLGGGEQKIAKQHGEEKLTARERLALLIDEGNFTELGIHGRPHSSQRAMEGREAPADGVITGYGKVEGRMVAVCAYDFTVMAGSMGMTGELKVGRLRELALTKRIPFIWLLDSAGENDERAERGGWRGPCRGSGVGDLEVADDEECILRIKQYLSFMPQNCEERPPRRPTSDPVDRAEEQLLDVLPESNRKPYDMYGVIERIVDEGFYFDMKPQWAKTIITCFARFGGRPVGIVANQPKQLGGILDNDSADKAARFVNLCNAFAIPLVFLMDVPGFMVGTKVEAEGIIRHGAKMLYAVANATVPKVTVITRKAYGAGYYVMNGRAYEPDLI